MNVTASSRQFGRVQNQAQARFSPFVLYGPIAFFFLYLTGTVLLFEFGPWPWPVDNKWTLYTYLTAAHVCVLLGYVVQVRKFIRNRDSRVELQNRSPVPRRLLAFGLVTNLIFLLPTSYARTGGIWPDYAGGLQDLGDVYEMAVEKSFGGDAGVLIEYCRIFLAPILASLLPLSVFFWREMKVRAKIATVFVFGFYIAIALASGINKTIVDLALLVPSLILTSVVAGRLTFTRKQMLAFCATVAIGGALALGVFKDTQISRVGSGAVGGYFGPPLNIQTTTKLASGGVVNDDVIVLYESFSRYVCTGYVALAWALDKDFTSTYGLGHSMFIARNAQRLGIFPAIDRSYPGKLEIDDGWGYFRLFDSIHTWIASDVSFPGALIIMFLIGRFLAQAWTEAITMHSPLAIINLMNFFQMLFYFPANNQVVQSPEPFVAFYFFLIAWQYAAYKHRRRQQNQPITNRAMSQATLH